MAGIISFKSGDWNVSGRGFRVLVAGVVVHLPCNRAGLDVKNALAIAVASELYFLDVDCSFDYEMIREFEKALAGHIADVKAVEIMGLNYPELHRGYLAQLAKIQEMLKQEIKNSE